MCLFVCVCKHTRLSLLLLVTLLKQVELRGLQSVEVFILDHSAEALLTGCRNCTIFLGPVASECAIVDCHNCVITIACLQLRVTYVFIHHFSVTFLSPLTICFWA
jgi:hypothetical protein